MASALKGKGSTTTSSLDDELAANGLRPYRLQPPSWRPPWLQGIENSGHPQFYPTCEGQDEDQLTEAAVKSGYSGKTLIQTENFSAHQLIYERLRGDTILPALSRLATAVVERAQNRVLPFGPFAFRLPQRLTLNDQKREAWLNDLANLAVPLSKLSRSVPHGFRGEKLIEMLYLRQIPVPRAVWYIRAIGAHEVQGGIKARATFTIVQYTREWTAVVQEFVRKQLAEIALPETASPAMGSGRANSKGVLVDGELRATWTTRFGYSLRLLEALYEEHLIERESFLRFLVHQTENSNIAQLPFVLFLVEEYMGDFLFSEPLSARLAYACFTRLSEIQSDATVSSHLEETTSALNSVIRSVFVALPDAFVACPLWREFSDQLETIMLANVGLDPSLSEAIQSDLADLKARAEASRECTQDANSVEPDELEMIQILDDIAFPVDLAAVHKALFHKRRRRLSHLNELDILFSWATTTDRSGLHRVYAVAALISMELDHPSSSESSLDVEAAFISWIDRGPPQDRWSVTLLLAELIRVGVMSYSLYLQRMIARGETEPRSDLVPPSLHLHLLRTVALDSEVGSSLGKRRMALLAGGAARGETQRLLENVQRLLSEVVPGIILNPPPADFFSLASRDRDCTTLLEALEVLAKDGSHLVLSRQWIPQGALRLLQAGHLGRPFSAEDHAVLAQILMVIGDLWGLLQYLLLVLRSNPARNLLFHVLDNIESNLVAWTSMAELPSLAHALLATHESFKSTGINDRRLVALLRQLGVAGYLEATALVQLEQDAQNLALSLSTSRIPGQTLASGMPELQSLVQDGSPQAVAQLATTLWYRYHSSENWGQVAFDVSVRLLSQVPVATILSLLREINERLPSGLEQCIARWVSSMSPARICSTFGGPLAPALASLFGELILRNTLSPVGAVTIIVLPAWSALLTSATAPPAMSSPSPTDDKSVQLRGLETIALIFGSIVGCDPSRDPSNSPSDLLLRQGSESRRTSLYVPSSMPDVGRCISMLAIQQELWTSRADYEKAHVASTLILHVSSGSSFKMAVARDPQSFSTAMLDSPCVNNIPAAPAMLPKLLAALLLILKDGRTATPASLVSTEEWDLFLSGLTTWRLAVSKVEVQACLERLDLDTALQDEEKAQALNTLSRHFLDRVCQGDGHMYLGEQVVRCYHGRASDELVSVAFSRLAISIDGLAYSASSELRTSSLTTLRCAGRLLDTLLQSGTASSRPEPLSALLIALKSCLEGLLDSDLLPEREVVLHVTLLLGLALRCAPPSSQQVVGASSAPPECSELFKDCLVPLTRLAALLAKSCSIVSDLASVLLDTCASVFFSVTPMVPWIRLPPLYTFFSSELDFDTLPEPILSRLSRLFGQQPLSIPVANAWELIEHADPGPIKDARHNTGPIDLNFFDAKVVESIPAVTALDAPQSPATSSGQSEKDRERGLQTNFDFETPATGLSISARDFRRTLVGAKSVVAKYDPTAKQKAKEAAAAESAAKSASAAAAAASSSTADSSSTTSRPAKRKEAPEVLIISDGDDDAPVRAPPAKRGRGGGTAASKSTSTRGTARRKSKG